MKNLYTIRNHRSLAKVIGTLILTICCGHVTLLAQGQPEEKSDTTFFRMGENRLEIINHYVEEPDVDTIPEIDDPNECSSSSSLTYWSGLDIGVSGLMNPDRGLSMSQENVAWELDYSKSIAFNLNFADWKANIVKDYVGLVTGLGLEFNAYAFKNDVSIGVSPDTMMVALDTIVSYSKNKLKTTYLNVPLLLEFNTSCRARRSFHVTAGMMAGWKIGSKWKYRFETDDEEVKNKVKSHYHVNPFKFSAVGRVGFGKFTFYGTYALNPLFEKDKGPELYPFSVGVAFTGI